MSTTLKWKPVKTDGRALGDGIKFVLRKTYHGNRAIFDGDDVPFLQGIEAAGNADVARDAAKLIEAIQKHGSIEFWEES